MDLGFGRTATAISSQGFHSCALLDDATVKCWGKNNAGQLGQNDTDNRGDSAGEMGSALPAIFFGTDRTAIAIATSNRGDLDYTCALLDNATVKCWGENGHGQLGQGSSYQYGSTAGDMATLSEIQLGTNTSVTSISIGKAHSCAVTLATNIKCWGMGNSGRTGRGNTDDAGSYMSSMGDYLPQVDLDGVEATVTPTHTPSLTPSYTETPTVTGTPTVTKTPTVTETPTATETPTVTETPTITETPTVTQTPTVTNTPSLTYTRSKTPTRSLTSSRTRTPTKSRTRTATPIGGVKEVVSVATGAEHTCVMLANDTVKCWGRNNEGQLGYDDTINRGSLEDQMGSNLAALNFGIGRTARAIAPGITHTCVILDDNSVKCWGSNTDGQLGYEDITSRGGNPGDMNLLQTVDLGTGRRAVAISSGENFTCVILDNGKVKCWGDGSFGNLGLLNTYNRGDSPDSMGDRLPYVDIGTGHTAKQIRTGRNFVCALLENDTVKCWGGNEYGQLGQGHTLNLGDELGEMGDTLPTLDFGTRRVQSIAASIYGACAIFDSGNVTCWGLNNQGMLGQGHTRKLGDDANEMGAALTNINLGSGHTAKAIYISYPNACAILDDDSIKCWGGNGSGQLGYGDTRNRGDDINEMGDELLAVNLGTNLTAKSLALGVNHLCVILNTNQLKCWGSNYNGQLGYNDMYDRGTSVDEIGNYLPPIAFGPVYTSTPTATSTKTSTPTKTATRSKTPTRSRTPTATR